MSWDVFISKTPVSELETAEFRSLGKKQDVISYFKSNLPRINVYEDWCVFKTNEFSIEFDLGEEDDVNHLMLYVRGDSNMPICIIKDICDHFEAHAMDCYDSSEIDFNQVENESFKAWQDYRNKVLKNL